MQRSQYLDFTSLKRSLKKLTVNWIASLALFLFSSSSKLPLAAQKPWNMSNERYQCLYSLPLIMLLLFFLLENSRNVATYHQNGGADTWNRKASCTRCSYIQSKQIYKYFAFSHPQIHINTPMHKHINNYCFRSTYHIRLIFGGDSQNGSISTLSIGVFNKRRMDQRSTNEERLGSNQLRRELK